MPISVQCTCGQRLTLKDELAGKRGKCPQCGAVITVPAKGADSPADAPPIVKPPIASTAPPPEQPAPGPGLGSLFDEEEIGVAGQSTAGPTKPCPQCHKLAAIEAVVCIECGWSFAAGRALETKRAPKKNQAANPYGYDPYYDHGDDTYTGKRRRGSRDDSGRRGPAWEGDDNLIAKYFQTVFEILVTPHFAFRAMRWNSGLGPPIMFVLAGYVIVHLLYTIFLFAWISAMGEIPGRLGGQFAPGDKAALGAGLLCSAVVGSAIIFVVMAIVLPLPMLISAGILHLCLLAVGGAKENYEATFRAQGYVMGAILLPVSLLSVFPIVGFLLGYAIDVVYTVVAIKHTHEIEWWQSVVANVLAVVVGFLLVIGMVMLIFMALGLSFAADRLFAS